jgi:hypothetical protein
MRDKQTIGLQYEYNPESSHFDKNAKIIMFITFLKIFERLDIGCHDCIVQGFSNSGPRTKGVREGYDGVRESVSKSLLF